MNFTFLLKFKATENFARTKTSSCIIYFVFVLCSFLSSSSANEQQEQERSTVCPENELIPTRCHCDLYPSNKIEIGCNGHDVTNGHITKLMKLMRSANNLEGHQPLNVTKVVIEDTKIKKLDLTPFLSTTSVIFQIDSNTRLHRIFVQSSNNTNESYHGNKIFDLSQVITTEMLFLTNNKLNNAGLNQTLQHFNSTSVKVLKLSYNKLRGSEKTDEDFIPGLSALRNLHSIDLSYNNIRKIAGGQLKYNNKLLYLILANNKVEKIEKGAFFLESQNFKQTSVNADSKPTFHIALNGNLLDDSKFSQNFWIKPGIDADHDLESKRRPIWIELWGNNFQFLSEKKFQPFLKSHPGNVLNFDASSSRFQFKYTDNIFFSMDTIEGLTNPFLCGSKTKWLKNERATYENQVLKADCINDRDKNVFTSSLTK